ncbi:G-protein coupled receptor 84-like [Scyliorhinus torazame]|uniref:G-protein coupled receptor 84-like n=1 Tax=Scyliorhinus torazame TaxID=75743 RepID=UPI003B5A4663
MSFFHAMCAGEEGAPNRTAGPEGNMSCDPSLSGYRYFGALLGLLVTAGGGAGNLLTVLAFAADARLRTRFNLLILNLTLADLVYCAGLQPLTVQTYLRMGWAHGARGCRLFGLLLFASNLISILNLVNIAVARYVLVSDPRRFDRTYGGRALPLFLLGPWLLSLAVLAPFWCVFRFLPPVCTCSFHRTAGRPYTTVLHAASFGLGLGSIGVCYLLIHRKMRAAARAVRRHAARVGPPPPPSSSEGAGSAELSAGGPEAESGATASEGGTGGGRLRRAATRWRGRRGRRGSGSGEAEFRRVTAMCFAMFLVYLGSYLPFCLAHLAGRRVPSVLQTLAGNLTWLNSCLNPLLYAAMNRQFRAAYGALLRWPGGTPRARSVVRR